MHYPFLRKISLAHPILSPALAISLSLISAPSWADTIPLSMNDPNLQATTFLSGLTQPIGIVFNGSINDFFVLEKASGQIKGVISVNVTALLQALSEVTVPEPSTMFAGFACVSRSKGIADICLVQVLQHVSPRHADRVRGGCDDVQAKLAAAGPYIISKPAL